MLDHYAQVRDLFAQSFTDESVKGELRSLLRHPFAARFPLTQALSCWFATLHGEEHPPLLKEGAEMLSVAEQCELALIWSAMGSEAGSELAALIAPLVEQGLTTLWASDKTLDSTEVLDLFLEKIGRKVSSEKGSPFFRLLDKLCPSIELNDASSSSYTLWAQGERATAYTHVGKRASLGAIRFGELSIPAFGFQAAPFGDSQFFGSDAFGSWHRPNCSKEVWAQLDPQESGFSLQTFGLSAGSPLFLSFYARASECRIGTQLLRPQSLARFQGTASSVILNQKETTIKLGFEEPSTVEVIPLAGKGEFWGSNYLIAFQLPVTSDKRTFHAC